ncbi:Organic hydroperoxide reductase OsmC/OhrA [Roseomonas rosea]|uniref:Organic hydroperoxide reductase OsmC/OhrA n=1 Tax=Muricoccus roseus TaxID=198092 RepID=A0A1M6IHD7_9PROT|nr:OsmC family protein [Roseomonas rosea]SHJ33887.1 Organic hydroperoxide reductase OsmC/OhrA [Roseomonas rosea]
MTVMSIRLQSIPGTEVALGWAGAHSVVVDRPEGRAGGQGLGFNGGQLLGLAIGGCFCNDLHYVAHEMGVRLASISVEVILQLEGSPLLATAAELRVSLRAEEAEADLDALVRRAEESSTVSNSLARGLPVRLSRLPG